MGLLTQYDQQANEDGCQRAHAQLEGLTLLHQFAAFAPETVGANATETQARLKIDACGAVHAGHVEALVAIHATLRIGRHNASLAATDRLYIVYRCGKSNLINMTQNLLQLS